MNKIIVHVMTVSAQNIKNELVSQVQVGNPYEETEEVIAPFQEQLIAVWDTGATATCITEKLADKLSLQQIGHSYSTGVTGTAKCRKFLISLHLPNGIIIPALEVSDCQGDIGCDVLIGMDVITMGDFAVSNFQGKTCFSFRVPSLAKTDYTTQMPNQFKAMNIDESKVNAPCPCGSGKKYKKCCKNNS